MAVLPSNLLRAFVSVFTSGVANTTTTGQLLPTPGISFRVRLWGGGASPGNTAQAAANWRAFILPAAGNTLLVAAGPNFMSSPVVWIPGGFALPDDTALNYTLQSALISLSMTVVAFYTVEATY